MSQTRMIEQRIANFCSVARLFPDDTLRGLSQDERTLVLDLLDDAREEVVALRTQADAAQPERKAALQPEKSLHSSRVRVKHVLKRIDDHLAAQAEAYDALLVTRGDLSDLQDRLARLDRDNAAPRVAEAPLKEKRTTLEADAARCEFIRANPYRATDLLLSGLDVLDPSAWSQQFNELIDSARKQ
jgi:vacuolar-type H+-ATPase subunit F/Vma7